LVATDPSYTAGLSPQTSHALVLLLLNLHQQGYLIAQIFFGLFLLPLGYLVYRSGYFPKALGIILMIGCVGYLTDIAGTYLSAGFAWSLSSVPATIAGLAELLFLLWLVVMGAKVPSQDQYVPTSQSGHPSLPPATTIAAR
jgi:hypothetical protein